MSIRIRVYPQTGAYGGLGMNRFAGQGAVSASTYFNSRLQTQKQVSSLQLGYERALWNERLEKVRLEERLKNPYAMAQAASPYGVASPYGGMVSPYGGVVSPYGYGAQQAYNPYATSMLGSSLLNSGAGFFGSLGLGGMF
ncbi:MAG: hypothetical protein JWM98_3238 [Thermoleophilia bacterium]|nr:hypothetical protein [Thermoleophilia bacterium]